MSVFDEEDVIFTVVVNEDEQYSLWPADLEVPEGWRKTGQRGTKAECARYIGDVWHDIRPRRLRKRDQTLEGT